MDTLIKVTNLVTVGNIGTVVFLSCLIITGYYSIRKHQAQQHAEYLAYVATLTANQTAAIQAVTEAQTSRIEACIHQTPGHPENPQNVPKVE